VFKNFAPKARAIGWPGPPDQKAGLAWSKYVLVDMFAKALQGDSPESAVAWAEGEYRQIYG
jgi:multiple sugar transport system substrate-binding protein